MSTPEIPVPRMPFEVPDAAGFHPLYIAGHPAASYQMTGLGLYVALLEPFIVKSVRRVLDRINDPDLKRRQTVSAGRRHSTTSNTNDLTR